MEHKKIVIPSLSFFQNELKGEGVVKSRRTLGELAGIFENQDAYSQLRGVKRNAINRVVRKNDNDFDN